MPESELDVVVLGAGAPGEVCAGRLAEAGLEVAIVEPHLVGGECSYYACMPSKALLRPGGALAEARRVPGAAEAVTGGLDAQAALDRRDEVVHGLDDAGQLPWLRERGIRLLRGEGRLVGERRVAVGAQDLAARRAVVVATGSAAAIPDIEGIDSVAAWTNREATTARRAPASMIVLGGGPVGVELAQAWASLGTAVTLVEGAARLIPREEERAAELLATALRERHGVDVRTRALVESVRPGGPGAIARLAGGDEVEGEEILLAVGRAARTGDIGLEAVGIEADGFLEVDEQMRVDGRDWLYAIGDVNGRALFTHMGKYQAWIAAEAISGNRVAAEALEKGLPRVTFTDPQVAAVGPTLAQAREAGVDAVAVDVAIDSVAGASFQGKGVDGIARLVIDAARGIVVGATFVGFETAELLHAATIAVVAEVPMQRLRHAVPAYPTRSEIWLKLLEECERRALG